MYRTLLLIIVSILRGEWFSASLSSLAPFSFKSFRLLGEIFAPFNKAPVATNLAPFSNRWMSCQVSCFNPAISCLAHTNMELSSLAEASC